MNVLGDYEVSTQHNDISRLPRILFKQQRAIKHVIISTSCVWQNFPRTLQGTCDFKNGIKYYKVMRPAEHCHILYVVQTTKIKIKIMISRFMFLTVLFWLRSSFLFFSVPKQISVYVSVPMSWWSADRGSDPRRQPRALQSHPWASMPPRAAHHTTVRHTIYQAGTNSADAKP